MTELHVAGANCKSATRRVSGRGKNVTGYGRYKFDSFANLFGKKFDRFRNILYFVKNLCFVRGHLCKFVHAFWE